MPFEGSLQICLQRLVPSDGHHFDRFGEHADRKRVCQSSGGGTATIPSDHERIKVEERDMLVDVVRRFARGWSINGRTVLINE